MITREPIYAALFAKLAGIGGFNTTSRRARILSDVPQEEQPALFVYQVNEMVNTVPSLESVHTLKADVIVYVWEEDESVSPSIKLNPLIDAIENALAPEMLTNNKQTLGGLVEHCWIEGDIQTDEGVLGNQALAIIPILIKAV